MLPAAQTPRVALHGLGLLAAPLATACMFALPPCASGPKEQATRCSGLYARPAGLVGAAEQGVWAAEKGRWRELQLLGCVRRETTHMQHTPDGRLVVLR